MHVIRRHFLAAAVDPAVSLPHTVLFRWKSFLDHVDHAALSAPGRWTTARPRTGTTRRWEDAAVESQIEWRRRVITGSGAAWGCRRRRITGGVGE